MKHIILGTAGHVDHGKTELIKALTGIETDRLKEEKERGLSIELGFAHFDLPNGMRIGVVDVPGHERFIDTMMAGAHGIDIALLAVSAKEGVQPQTREHLEALNLLEIRRGVLVLTMRDLTDDEETEFALEEARETLEGTSLAGIPAAAVSARTGEGMDELKRLIEETAMRAAEEEPEEDGVPTLPVDRVFILDGIGAVVTGTLRGGYLEEGESVVLWPEEIEARVRSVHTHGKNVPRAGPGQRAALNLAGVRRSQLSRGQVVTLPNHGRLATRIDVDLRIAGGYPRIVERWTRARLHIGTAETFCRIVPLAEDAALLPGESGSAQLRTEKPIFAHRGDRFLIRNDSIQRILGGGRILDPIAPIYKRSSPASPAALQIMSGGSDEAVLLHLLTRGNDPFFPVESLSVYFPMRRRRRKQWIDALEADKRLLQAGAFLIEAGRFQQLQHEIETTLQNFHEQNPLASGMGSSELRNAVESPVSETAFEWTLNRSAEAGVIERDGNLARLSGRQIEFDEAADALRAELERRLQSAGLAAPSEAELNERYGLELVNALTQLGTLVKIADGYWIHRSTYEETLQKLRAAFQTQERMDIAAFRELTGASRKYALPFLEHCDQQGWTLRVGNARKASQRFLSSQTPS